MKQHAIELQMAEQLEQLSLGYGLKREYVTALKTASQIMRVINHNAKNELSAEDLRAEIASIILAK